MSALAWSSTPLTAAASAALSEETSGFRKDTRSTALTAGASAVQSRAHMTQPRAVRFIVTPQIPSTSSRQEGQGAWEPARALFIFLQIAEIEGAPYEHP